MNKNSKFPNQLFLTCKKIRIEMLFSLAEIKIIQSKNRVFKSFAINQSESSFNGHGIFNKFKVNQSKMSSTSHRFFNNFDIKQSELNMFLVTLFVGNHPTRIQHFLKVIFLSFFKNFNNYLKNIYQKTFELPRIILQEKKFHLIFSLMK